MLSQNRWFLTPHPTVLSFLLRKINNFWPTSLPYRDDIVYGRPLTQAQKILQPLIVEFLSNLNKIPYCYLMSPDEFLKILWKFDNFFHFEISCSLYEKVMNFCKIKGILEGAHLRKTLIKCCEKLNLTKINVKVKSYSNAHILLKDFWKIVCFF